MKEERTKEKKKLTAEIDLSKVCVWWGEKRVSEQKNGRTNRYGRNKRENWVSKGKMVLSLEKGVSFAIFSKMG